MDTPNTTPASATKAPTSVKVVDIVRLGVNRSDLRELRVVDVDIVAVLHDGRKVYIREGAVRAMTNPDLKIVLQDGSEVLAQAVLQQSGTYVLDGMSALTGSGSAAAPGGASESPAVLHAGGADTNGFPIVGTSSVGQPTAVRTGSEVTTAGDGGGAFSWFKSLSPAWGALGALGALGAVGAAVGGGSSTGGGGASFAYLVTGEVVLGPVISALAYTVYDSQGNVLASGSTDSEGRFSARISQTYSGPILIKVINANDAGVDYMDESNGQSADIGSGVLRAAAVADGKTDLHLNVNPVTESAVRLMGAGQDRAPADAQAVTNANREVAAALGLGNILSDSVAPVIDASGNPSTDYASASPTAQLYGDVLASMAGIDNSPGRGFGSSSALVAEALASGTGVREVFSDRLGAPVLSSVDAEAVINTSATSTLLSVEYDWISTQDIVQLFVQGPNGKVAIGSAHRVTPGEARNEQVTLRLSSEDLIGLADGRLQLKVEVSSPLISASSNLQPVVVGRTSPQLLQSRLAAESDSGSSQNDGVTRAQDGLVYQVAVTPGAQVRVVINGQTYEATADPDGTTHRAITGKLPDGIYTPRVEITDSAGNRVSRDGQAFSVKSSIASEEVSSRLAPESDSGSNNSDGVTQWGNEISYQVTAALGATVTVQLGGVDYQAIRQGSRYVARLPALADGTYSPTILITDAAGNSATMDGTDFTVRSSRTPTINLVASSDTGTSSTDGLTNSATPTFVVRGQLGDVIHVFNDLDLNGELDAGELLGQVSLVGGLSRQMQVDLRGLADGEYSIRALASDAAGFVSEASEVRRLVLDTDAPAAPSMTLQSASDTGTAGDNITSRSSVGIDFRGESGGRVFLFADRNRNGVEDSGERIGAVTLGDDSTGVLTAALSGPGTHYLRAIQADAAGNWGGTSAELALQVRDSDSSIRMSGSQSVISLDGRIGTGVVDGLADGILANGASGGERLTLDHLGVAAATRIDQVNVSFNHLNNISVQKLSNGTWTPVTEVALRDIAEGLVKLTYFAGSVVTQGVTARVDFQLFDVGDSTRPIMGSLAFEIGGVQAVIWGGESGPGAKGATFSGNGNTGTSGADGVALLLGSSQGDLMFGDGSGGGGSPRIGGGGAQPPNSAGGSGANAIFGAGGDDIIFGDGFGSSLVSLRDGGYGGGGGGGRSHAQGTGFSLGGVGGGYGAGTTSSAAAGGPSTLGAPANGRAGEVREDGGRWGGGGGAGVSADGNASVSTRYVAELDAGANSALGQFNGTGTTDGAWSTARSVFLAGAGNSIDNRPFTQAMGAGNDELYGGAGNDYLMGGGGENVLVGGQGNDIMYGHAGLATQARGKATLVWMRGDAGPTGALDIVRDFSTTAGDVLDISQLLEGYEPGVSDLAVWVTVYSNVRLPDAQGWDAGKSGTLIEIDPDGLAGPGTALQRIFLSNGVVLGTDVNALVNSGVLDVDRSHSVPAVASAPAPTMQSESMAALLQGSWLRDSSALIG